MNENGMAIAVTLPASVEWEDYEAEIAGALYRNEVLNFKVSAFPRHGIGPGSRCYVVWRGYVRGWMEICGFSDESFTCTTSGKDYSGKFIQRSGPFHYLEGKLPEMKGFQGFRYVTVDSMESGD